MNTLNELMQHEGDALVVQLPRVPGRKDSEYMHLFGGPVDIEAYALKAQSEKGSETSKRSSMSELEQRVSQLEVVDNCHHLKTDSRARYTNS